MIHINRQRDSRLFYFKVLSTLGDHLVTKRKKWHLLVWFQGWGRCQDSGSVWSLYTSTHSLPASQLWGFHGSHEGKRDHRGPGGAIWKLPRLQTHEQTCWLKPFSFRVACCMCYAQSLQSCRLFATPWTTDKQVPLSMGFPRQEYWSGYHFLTISDNWNTYLFLNLF